MLAEHVREESLRDTDQPAKASVLRLMAIHIKIGFQQEQATHNCFPLTLGLISGKL